MNARRSSQQATIVKPEQALPLKAFGLDLKVLLTTEATAGAISVLMGWHKPGEGPPDHLHGGQEEVFFILDGTYELTVGGQTSTAGPGTIVFIPRNVVHRFRNVGDTTARMLDWSLPGGQDHYFKAISDLARRRRLHRRQGAGDQQEVRHALPIGIGTRCGTAARRSTRCPSILNSASSRTTSSTSAASWRRTLQPARSRMTTSGHFPSRTSRSSEPWHLWHRHAGGAGRPRSRHAWLIAFAEELAQGDTSSALAFNVHLNSTGGIAHRPAIRRERKKRVAQLAAEEGLMCTSVSEPASSSLMPVAFVPSVQARTESGGYRLYGKKFFASMFEASERLRVSARASRSTTRIPRPRSLRSFPPGIGGGNGGPASRQARGHLRRRALPAP
jgi:quercetin dioxygenase-like cupin family protein